MIEMDYAHRMDFVNICRANTEKTLSECLHLWREWLEDTYGQNCVEIKGRKYPPSTWKSKPFKGSILYEGETAAERRIILAGGYIPPDIAESTEPQKFLDLMKEKVRSKNEREKTTRPAV